MGRKVMVPSGPSLTMVELEVGVAGGKLRVEVVAVGGCCRGRR